MYLFNQDIDKFPKCFQTAEFSSSGMRSVTTEFDANGYSVTYPADSEWNYMNQFLAYESRYAGSFDLLDTQKYPRMCASGSLNLTDGLVYYRG